MLHDDSRCPATQPPSDQLEDTQPGFETSCLRVPPVSSLEKWGRPLPTPESLGEEPAPMRASCLLIPLLGSRSAGAIDVSLTLSTGADAPAKDMKEAHLQKVL